MGRVVCVSKSFSLMYLLSEEFLVVSYTSFFKIITANYEQQNRPQKDRIDSLSPLYRVIELFCFIKTTDEKTKSLKIQFPYFFCGQNPKHTSVITAGLDATLVCLILRGSHSDKV